MNTNFKIDLSIIPTTFDAIHVSLATAVVVLALLLIFCLILMIVILMRKPKAPVQEPVKEIIQTPPAEPEIKIVEKIVEVEKIVPGPAPEPVVLKETTPDAAMQFLSLLQKEARFIDFIKEDVTAYSDTDIGAAARVVHEGCVKAVKEHFSLKQIRQEQEGSKITLQEGFDPSRVRLTGNIVGKAPFTGTLIHRGWEVTDIRLPKLTKDHNVNIIASAEVEL